MSKEQQAAVQAQQWGASSVITPEYKAEQSAKNAVLRDTMDSLAGQAQGELPCSTCGLAKEEKK